MINSLHLHLILVHIPIVLYPLSVLLLTAFYFRKYQSLRVIGSLLIIAATTAAISAYLTGEGAEEIAENLPGVLESAIELHEDAAVISLWLSCITAVLAVLGMLSHFWNQWARSILVALFFFATVSSVSFFWVGYQGGKIRHPEAYSEVGATNLSHEGDRR